MASITDSEIENELRIRNYFAVSPGSNVPPQDNETQPSTPAEQHIFQGISNQMLLLIAFGVMVILFE